ncbi:hypothetical protein GJR95_38050 [Spirosoma endbachense]|uniref:Lipocalin-like domain-containing protein n=1 Tax=Spirosoma endbachense TaxID=2666025 RepID=A0A6P1WC90_9BACT|nr:hypothetical protein GJR95_38050 [Spirosoma endbachense]
MYGCGTKEPEKSLSERIRQVWTVNIAKENSTTVYTKGGTGNPKPGYSQFKLDLTQEQTVRLTEVDNNTFVGTWALSADNTKLTLSGLTPQPSGSNGTIEYTVDSDASETVLNLNRLSQNLKTGSATTRYELIK